MVNFLIAGFSAPSAEDTLHMQGHERTSYVCMGCCICKRFHDIVLCQLSIHGRVRNPKW